MSARRELHAIAEVLVRSCPPPELEQVLATVHPEATRVLPGRELAAIVALATRPLGDA